MSPNIKVLSLLLVAAVSFTSSRATATPVQFEDFQIGPPVDTDGNLGASLALDGNILVAGMSGDNTLGNSAGAAYVFRLLEGLWIQEQKLLASDGAASAKFGSTVAISGNLIVIGTGKSVSEPVHFTPAYVFRYDGNSWIEEQKLLSSESVESNGILASTVAVSDDVVLVGQYGLGGSAHVFRFNGGLWAEEQVFTPIGPPNSNQYAKSVGLSGNVAIVSDYESPLVYHAYGDGAVYVFRFDGTSWSQEQRLTSGEMFPHVGLGYSVAISGNVIVAGSPGYSDGVVGPFQDGAAYIFRYDGVSWIEEQRLSVLGIFENYLGYSVGVASDVVIVGGQNFFSPYENAHIFRFNGLTWVKERELFQSGLWHNDGFAESAVISDNLVVVGARSHYNSGSQTGAAYVYDVTRTEECSISEGACLDLTPQTCADSGGTPGGWGTYCLSGTGDLNGDGLVNLADFKRFKQFMNGPHEGISALFAPADFNSDQSVDLRDVAVFQNNFTGDIGD